MNWLLVALLTSVGLAMGVASALGWTRGLEGKLWLAIAAVFTAAVVIFARERPFAHGALIGALCGVVAPLMQAILIDVYLANNADFASRIPSSFSPRVFVLLTAVPIALLSAAVLGSLSWVAAKIANAR